MTKFPVDISEDGIRTLLNSPDSYARRFSETSLRPLLGYPEIKGALSNKRNEFPPVPWDMEKLRAKVKSEVSKHVFGWYGEAESAAGDSTRKNVEAFSKYRITPRYLRSDKSFSYPQTVVLSSKELGVTRLTSPTPVFVAPYGAANLYGKNSDEVSCAQGATDANVVYTLGHLTKYTLEKICRAVSGNAYYFNSRLRSPGGAPPFSMFQIYLTDDDDINRSIIERVKRTNLSVLIFTVDAGAGHGGIQMMDDYADFTYASKIAGNLFEDPMFNYKCFLKNRCVGTRTPSVLAYASRRLRIPVAKLARTFDLKNAFTYAHEIQFKGMAKQNSDKNPKSKMYPWSVAYLARLAHTKQTISPAYSKITHRRGLPLVVKGVMSVEDAVAVQKSGADGIYVSNHGGRFVFNSVSPIDVLKQIHQKVKKSDPRFGVWFDSGVRSATDVLIAYSQGAEFVGIGRPVIYACVDNGRGGVRQVLQSILYTLRDQARLCGLTSLAQLHEKNRPIIVHPETSRR